MKQLLIIGARGFGREVYNLFLECKRAGLDIECKGFLDSQTDALKNYENYPSIISSVEDYECQPDDVFVCALGDVTYKKQYVNYMKEKGAQFISLIHPDTKISMNTTIGEGCIIREASSISCDVKVGDFVTIMSYTVIGHDASIGDWSHIGSHCFMGGFSKIKESVTMHPGARLLPHKTVEEGAVIGAGSVVLNRVKKHTTVFGVPAKRIEF